ncbi:hypothetical protein GCM10011415_16000 [Salipiger pallidus]|uniref:LTXXQ motif family protein n=1 Tax=Salipiger pallidus TaxID=1775170 RepID=A0A8J2ZIT1_9RHOB|nr:hypothetical protein [Salipiger pallidus]GGG69400.1 hypothetical protein GCM10011415_16000 [Salipiger pallidus]
MKRFITLTALSTVIATSAFAASEAEMTAIDRYYPEANYETLSDEQVAQMFAIANSGESDTDKTSRIEEIASSNNPSTATATVSDSELTAYVPEWRLAELTEEERAELIALVSSNDNPEETRVQVLESMNSATPNLTPGEMKSVERIAPGADLSVLTTEQVQQIRAALYGEQNDTEKKSRIDQILS